MNEEITQYIADERSRGVRDEDIKKELLAKGWKEADIDTAVHPSSIGAPPLPSNAPSGTLITAGALVSDTWSEITKRFQIIGLIMAAPVLCYVFAALIPQSGISLAMRILALILEISGGVLAIVASIGIMRQVRAGWALSLENTYRAALPYFWSVIWVSVLAGLAVFGGTLLLVIPGIIVAIWLSFARLGVVLDDLRGLDALSYSRELVRGMWWGVAWRLCIMGAIILIVLIVLSFIPIIGALSSIFTLPFGIIYTVKLYDALKAHKGVIPAQTKGRDRGLYITLCILGIISVILFFVALVAIIEMFIGVAGDSLGPLPLRLPADISQYQGMPNDTLLSPSLDGNAPIKY